MLTYPYVPPPPPRGMCRTAENSVADNRAAAVEIRARVRKPRRRGTRARAGVCNCRYLILSRRRRRSGAGGRRARRRRRRRPASRRKRTAPTPLTPSYLLYAAPLAAAVCFFPRIFVA